MENVLHNWLVSIGLNIDRFLRVRRRDLLYNYNVMLPTKKIDILGYGSFAVDDLLYVEHFPDPDTKIEVKHRERHAGGLTGTAMVTASRLGVKTGVFGFLGENDLSNFTRDVFIREGIDVSRLITKEEAFPIYSTIVIEQQTGKRTIYFSMQGFNPVEPSGIPETLCEDIRYLFTDSCVLDHFPRLFSLAQDTGVLIIVDIETKKILNYPDQFEAIDYLILNKSLAAEIANSLDPVEILDRLTSRYRKCSVITHGDQGSWIKVGSGSVYHLPAYKVEVVDTTGCGDVFHGAFAAALIYGEEPLEAARWASAAAALKATRPGGQEGIPSLDVLMDFIQSQPNIELQEIH